jgi:GT2 family glycosyltransferase
VDHFVSDLAAQDFSGALEVLVADGNSDDGSPERLRAAAWSSGLNLRVLPNPAGWVSQGLNTCIRAARGDLIVRLDCHSRYPADYLRRCAELSESTGAWNVGGRLVPTGTTPTERAVACAMDSPFGGIGWTRAASSGPVATDTVTFGAFRPEAFEQAGLFDETLVRNQDDEFNLRLRRAGGEIMLDPDITVMYRPRGSIARVWRQYYEYGL